MQRHHLRIRIKKLRYALDFSIGLHQRRKKRRKAFENGLKELQDALGQLNDTVVARSLRVGPAWPLTMPREPDEGPLLRDAKAGLKQLRKIGAYW
jgi:CHAD domain-containing protein